MKLFNELRKNFKLLFRSKSTLALLVVAPLLLILLVGFAFSGEDVHSITIGVVVDGEIDLSLFKSNISEYGSVKEFESIELCVADMYLQNTHLCLHLKGSFANVEGSSIPEGEVVFYYDNSQKALSTLVVNRVSEFFGIAAHEISLVSAQRIFENIQNLVFFLNDRVEEIKKISEEASNIRADLLDRKQELIRVQASFDPKYRAVKSAQKSLNEYADILESSVDSINLRKEQIKMLDAELDILISQVDTILAPLEYTFEYNMTPLCTNLTYDVNFTYPLFGYYNLSSFCNETDGTVNLTMTQYWNLVSSLRDASNQQIEDVSGEVYGVHEEILKFKEEFDGVVYELDQIDQLLKDEIERSDYYVALIDNSTLRMYVLTDSLSARLGSLNKLDPELAEKLVNPISQKLEAILPESKNVQNAFPLILATVTIFISILFANVVTILEVNNKAYIRNLLSPVNDFVFTAGLAITNFIVISVQVCVLLVVGQVRFGLDILSGIYSILPVLSVLILIFVFLGMLFAYLSKTTQSSILLTTFAALAFFLFSNAVTALEAMPPLASSLAKFNPLVISTSLLRGVILFRIPLELMIYEFAMLCGYGVVLLVILTVVSKSKNKKRF